MNHNKTESEPRCLHRDSSYITTWFSNWFCPSPSERFLNIFLHIQNAISRIRIPRHGASSQLQLPYRHETDVSKWIWPVSSHHTEFRVRRDTGKWWALGKQEQYQVYCNRAVSQDRARNKKHVQLTLDSSKRSESTSVESWWLSYETLIWSFHQFLPVPPQNAQHRALGCPDIILQNPNTTEVPVAKSQNLLNTHHKLDSSHAQWS